MAMNYSLIIPGMLIQLVIMGYYFFRPRLPIRLNRSFLAILTIELGTELLDVLSVRLNETWALHDPALLWASNLLYFIFFFSRSYMFFVFAVSALDARTLQRSSLSRLAPVVYFPCVAAALSSPFTGWIFFIENGYHPGPHYWLLYFCGFSYLLFSVIAILRHVRELNRFSLISLLAIQVILLAGYIVRMLMPHYIVMNTFVLMAIVVIFISFLNPDLYLSERGDVFNLPALRALLTERTRRHHPCRVLGFVLQNYNEHREIFGGRQMDDALTRINRWLVASFPLQTPFYLRNGVFVLVGDHRADLSDMQKQLANRFALPWKVGAGELRLGISLVKADTDLLNCSSERLINTLMISLDELSRVSEPEASLSLSDSIEEINRKLDIRRCLEKALDQDGLEVFLQPLVSCATGKRVAAEALVRLRDKWGALIPPDLFITMAEREGQIVRLGEQVLSKVCRFLRDNDAERLGVQWINVNLSPVQFMSRNIPDRFTGIVRECGVSEKMVHLEITEQSMIDFSLLRDQIMGLHENGFEFCLDDYGSGYSNLSRVRQYPFTNIKIDMEVVRNYCRDRDPLLPSLIQAFRQMGMTVTAEGVETEDMAQAMADIGCDYLQGYYFSRPVSMEEFLSGKQDYQI